MIKRILVPLDASKFTTTAIRAAVDLAKGASGKGDPCVVEGLSLVDLDQIPAGRFADMVPRDQIISESKKIATELEQKFKKQATELGLKPEQILTQHAQGSPFQEIIRESVFSDIMVMGYQCSFPPVNRDYDTMHHLYHSASRPVIVTDQDYSPVEAVVVAMDGTASASRMLYTLMHLNPFPKAKVVLTYSERERQEHNLGDFFERVGKSLTSHGMKITISPYKDDLETEAPEIMNRAGAQMLALGAHRGPLLQRLADPFNLKESFAQRLLNEIKGALFIVS